MHMKLIVIVNYLNPHDIEPCKAFHALLKDEFFALETTPPEDYRSKIGWISEDLPYKGRYQDHLDMVLDADTVLYGGIVDRTIAKRIHSGKRTFLMTERPYKIPTTNKTFIKRRIGSWLHFHRYQCENFSLLAMGCYVKEDMQSFNNFNNKIYRWGYFPELYTYTKEERTRNNKRIKIIWAGRILNWKHPEMVLSLSRSLREMNIDFEVLMIGGGELLQDLKSQAETEGLPIEFKDFMPYQDVRKAMLVSDIFLSTSDRYEGWGVVVNEAMNAGCVPIVSRWVGASGYLIQNGKNGLTFDTQDELLSHVLLMIQNKDLRLQLSENAYQTIHEEWNAGIAAQRLLQTIENGTLYMHGPMSKEEGWK